MTNPINNCKFYGANMICIQCHDGYLLREDTKLECKKLDIPNCSEYKFSSDNIECKVCK